MKTNKAEREAIASKFIKRMEEKLVLKTQELSKAKGFKEIQKNIEILEEIEVDLKNQYEKCKRFSDDRERLQEEP